MPTYEQLGFGQGAALTGDRARAVFGQVMGLVAFALGFAALGAYVARDVQGGGSFLFFIGAFACIFGLQAASARGHEQLAVGLLFGLALLLGMAVSSIIVYYVKTDPGVVWQAAGCTALFTAALGGYGYSTQRNLSTMYKWAFRAFWVVLLFGIIALFVAIPASNLKRPDVGGLWRLHDLRLQPARQATRQRQPGADCGQDLPGHLQRVHSVPESVRRRRWTPAP